MAYSPLGNISNTLVGGASITPQTITSATTTNGSAIDMQLSDDEVGAAITLGTLTDSTLTVQVKLQENAVSTGGTWTDMLGNTTATQTITASIAGSTAGVAAQTVFIDSRKRQFRYVRAVVITTGGGTLSCPIAVSVIAGLKKVGSGAGNFSAAATTP